MEIKALEIRDVGTFIPVIAIRMVPADEPERYLLRRSGYGDPIVLLVKMNATGNKHEASYDPYGWGPARTMGPAHAWINDHWDEIQSGDVIDTEFILGESKEPKKSERLDSFYL